MDCFNRATFVVVTSALLFSTTAAEADLFKYDPNLGTLPTAQGWAKEVLGTPSIDAVSGGVFGQFSISSNSVTSWSQQTNPIDFMSADATTLETRLRVKLSERIDPSDDDDWRAGFALAMTDSNDRHIILGITSTGVRLTNDLDWADSNSSAWANLGTSMFHTYKLVAQNGTVALYINGVPTLTLDVGDPDNSVQRTNTIQFGDVSTLAASATTLTYLDATTVPEPSSLVLLSGMMGLGLIWWRRKKRA